MRNMFSYIVAGYVCAGTCATATATDLMDDLDFTVITPTKLKQSLHDTPASVTVITRDQIHELGINTVAEVMRLVPGMAVGITTMNNYQLSYLSPTVRATRRMNVLIDGMSIYRVDFSRIEWINIPVHINDIERIEVTRSPSASVYGANSFEAVINIITRHPQDALGAVVEVYGGSLNTAEGYVGYGDKYGETAFHLTLSSRVNDGYDTQDNNLERRDETDLDSFNFRVVTETDHGEFDYAVGGVKGVLTLANSDARRISPSDQYIEDYTVNFNYTLDINDKNTLKVHADTFRGEHIEEWTTCYYAIMFTDELRAMYIANPMYAQAILTGQMPSGGTAQDDALAAAVFNRAATMTNPTYLTNICGQINENSVAQHSVLNIEETYVHSNTLRTIVGIGINFNTIDSKTYLGGKTSNTNAFASANMEYKFLDFVLNAGLMTEEIGSRTEKDTVYSPRLGLNYHATPTDTVRFILSKAYRTPDTFEQFADWNYTMTGMTPPLDGVTSEALFYLRSTSPGNLISEEVLSKEVSYYGVFPSIGAVLDIKLFHINMSNLIADKGYFFSFNLNNYTTAERAGGDLEFHIQSTRDMNNSLGYSYLDCDSVHPFEDQPLCARHSGFLTTTVNLDEKWDTSLAYYASSSISGLPFRRMDWVLGYSNNRDSYVFDASFIVRHYGEDGGYTFNQSTMITNKFDKNTQFFFEMGIKY